MQLTLGYDTMRHDQECLPLPEYLDKYRVWYHDLLTRYQRGSLEYDNCIFAILSVHTRFSINVEWFKKHRAGCLDWTRLGLPKIRLQNLEKLNSIYPVITAENLERVQFLGQSKRFFGLAFIDPYYFCLDVHMLNYYKVSDKPCLSLYRKTEDRLRNDAYQAHYLPFAFQWAVWEYQQKRGHIDHSFLIAQGG